MCFNQIIYKFCFLFPFGFLFKNIFVDVFTANNFIYIAGVIRNTRVLNYSESHSYVLSVVAQDCGSNKSKPLLVTVEVKQACNTGWTGKFELRKLNLELNARKNNPETCSDLNILIISTQDYPPRFLIFLVPAHKIYFPKLHFLSVKQRLIARVRWP